jgi:pantothenate kinase
METSILRLSERIKHHAQERRILVALAGPPGAGKSTLAGSLKKALGAENIQAQVVPMDGFHLDDAILVARGWRPRKGAPKTYDVAGLKVLLERLRSETGSDVFYPVFDRATESSRAAADAVTPEHRVVIVEGNYLLLDEPGWRDIAALFDHTIMVMAPLAELQRRLVRRWLDHGHNADAAMEKVAGNDLLNAELVITRSLTADLTFEV